MQIYIIEMVIGQLIEAKWCIYASVNWVIIESDKGWLLFGA